MGAACVGAALVIREPGINNSTMADVDKRPGESLAELGQSSGDQTAEYSTYKVEATFTLLLSRGVTYCWKSGEKVEGTRS